MDLWIRNQRKERLCKVDNLILFCFTDSWCQIRDNNGNCLGDYESKERALQILDEIQSLMKEKRENIYATKEVKTEYYKEPIKYFKEMVKLDCIVYEMPKE